MEKKPGLTPSESLQIISGMINTVQKRYCDNGFLYLFWGWLAFFCGITEFILLHFFNYPQHYLVWSLTWAGLIFQVFYLRKKIKAARVRTYADTIIGYVWLSFVILMFVMFYQVSHLDPKLMSMLVMPVMLALYGLPVFLSGIILRFRPLVVGGICCWILSITASVISYEYQLLLIPVAMIVAWILPGFILRKKFSEEVNSREAIQNFD